jgi:hypothetical protein
MGGGEELKFIRCLQHARNCYALFLRKLIQYPAEPHESGTIIITPFHRGEH